MIKKITTAMALTVALAGSVAAAPVNWTGSSSVGPGSRTIFFTGFESSELSSISGSGLFHAHNGGTDNVRIDILLDSVWTNIFSTVLHGNTPNRLLSSLSPMSFAGGIVSGLRLSGQTSNTFHSLALRGRRATIFNFNDVTLSVVPVPAAMPLLLGALLGFGALKRRKKSVV